MGRLDGRIAWVTGAGSGIGEAAAILLAQEGAALVLSGRRRRLLEDVAQHIAASGGTVHVAPGDLTRADEVEAIGTFLSQTLGRLDVLVNNAGVNIPDRAWSRLTVQGVDTLLQGNLTSAVYCVRVALGLMRPRQSGTLIHVASMAGRRIGSVGGPIYSAAKHAVVAMSHGINVDEGANGIRSSVICPGEVDTPFLAHRSPPIGAEARAKLLISADVAEMIRYVACAPPRVRIDEVMITPTRF